VTKNTPFLSSLKSGKGVLSMKKVSLNEKLEKERRKLNKLGEEALKNGIPPTQDEAFMAQNRKVDAFVVKIIKEKERHREKKQER
jgi:hypothetical protein